MLRLSTRSTKKDEDHRDNNHTNPPVQKPASRYRANFHDDRRYADIEAISRSCNACLGPPSQAHQTNDQQSLAHRVRTSSWVSCCSPPPSSMSVFELFSKVARHNTDLLTNNALLNCYAMRVIKGLCMGLCLKCSDCNHADDHNSYWLPGWRHTLQVIIALHVLCAVRNVNDLREIWILL